MFTAKEIDYLNSQRLARLATVDRNGQPDAVPVSFEYDGTYFYVGGENPTHTRKYQNLRAGNDKVALILDDLLSVSPWRPRGIRIYGQADFIERDGIFGPGVYMRIVPTVSWSWNVERPAFPDQEFDVNKVVHDH